MGAHIVKRFAKDNIMLALKTAFASIVAVVLSMGPVVNWGVCPQGQHNPPAPPAGSAKLLDEYNGLFRVNTDEKRVYFTFDLGYEAGYTGAVLDTLKAHNIKGIFFLCGNYLKETALIERMHAEGHIIGNHTDRHKDLPTLSPDAIKTDIMDFQTKYLTQYPDKPAPTFMRPPKGRFDDKTLTVARDNGFRTMLWSIATVDWGKTAIDADKTAATITKRLHPGAIMLCHITNAGMPKTIEKVLPMIALAGYTVGDPHEI